MTKSARYKLKSDDKKKLHSLPPLFEIELFASDKIYLIDIKKKKIRKKNCKLYVNVFFKAKNLIRFKTQPMPHTAAAAVAA